MAYAEDEKIFPTTDRDSLQVRIALEPQVERWAKRRNERFSASSKQKSYDPYLQPTRPDKQTQASIIRDGFLGGSVQQRNSDFCPVF